MPMYYPDLKSVQVEAKMMMQNKPPYTGIFPVDESELPRARKELGAYMRDVWHDEIAALEIEMAATAENYNEAILAGFVARKKGTCSNA